MRARELDHAGRVFEARGTTEAPTVTVAAAYLGKVLASHHAILSERGA